MNCDYCVGDRDDYVKFLPKDNKGFNGCIRKSSIDKPKLIVTGTLIEARFYINFCPMCGKKLIK